MGLSGRIVGSAQQWLQQHQLLQIPHSSAGQTGGNKLCTLLLAGTAIMRVHCTVAIFSTGQTAANLELLSSAPTVNNTYMFGTDKETISECTRPPKSQSGAIFCYLNDHCVVFESARQFWKKFHWKIRFRSCIWSLADK